MKNATLLILSITFFFQTSCKSYKNQKLGVKNCKIDVEKISKNSKDANIICPCLVPKLLKEFKNNSEVIEAITKWDIEYMSRKDSVRRRTTQIMRECIFLPSISNSEIYSDYPKQFKEHFRKWIKKVLALKFPDTSLDLESCSKEIMAKIERKYSYDEIKLSNFDSSFKSENIKIKKQILVDITTYCNECN